MRLRNRVAVVTGGGAGIGEAVAKAFAAEGASVIIAEIDEDRGSTVEAAIQGAGGNALFAKTDVGSTASVDALGERVKAEFGQVDILFNNAAIQLVGQDSRTHEVAEEIWDRTININLKGYWRSMRAFIPLMLTHGGTVINVASPTGMLGVAPGYSAYSTSKGGVFAMTRVAAAEYSRDGIRVNCIVPGATLTPLTAEIFADAEERELFEQNIPMGRLGTPDDLVGLSLFLASDDSAYCTGGTYMADGGLTAI
ncbi:MAG: glucose 1-dehydrogenase [Chloroflexi bacterium]|nr:glucose 1-dehydrogenase [Chloroflexota bacterium]